jgi:hypothetical protein
VIRKLNRIRLTIASENQQPFPKSPKRLLSFYAFVPRKIKLNSSGNIVGGMARLVVSLIDFSFVRSIVAPAYSRKGGHTYDPVSLFLLQLFCCLEKFSDMKSFLNVVRDPEKGKHYRLYAGIRYPHIPGEADFSHLKNRLGEDCYQKVAQVLVKIVHLLDFLTFSILSIDGTLFPSYTRYRGCTYFCQECASIKFEGLIDNVRKRILYKLKDPKKILLGREIKVKVECPSHRFPEEIPKPKVEILTLSLKIADPDAPNPFNRIFGVEEELKALGLDLSVKKVNFHSIDLDQIDSFFFRCPKLPSDTEARIGVRKNPKNPDKIEKVFGYNGVFLTSIELSLGLELPVACLTIAGNAQEGNQFIPLKEQIQSFQPNTIIDLADAKYDELHNYQHARSLGSIPMIDYNVRNEDVSLEGLKKRGYDRNGWPFAPCGVICRPNGFDSTFQRATFTCQRPCVSSLDHQLKTYSQSCPHFFNHLGFIKHMSIKQYPRLITEVIRGTPRYQKLRSLRSASERTNSTAKEDLDLLRKPKVRGIYRAGILVQLTMMAILLGRVTHFILKVTIAVEKERFRNPNKFIVIKGPKVPKFILNLIQRK